MFFIMESLLSHPIVKRKMFCMLICIAAGIILALSLPGPLVNRVPLAQAGAIVNGMIMGAMLTMAGLVNWHPAFNMRLHPIIRGGMLAAVVHLNYVIYAWYDQSTFWTTILLAAIFGAVVDALATQMFGEGKKLAQNIVK